MTTIDYKSAGVNIEAGNEAVSRIKDAVQRTFSPHVLTDIGSFGAMYDLKSLLNDYDHPVLVQSIDGVGTKIMVAKMMGSYKTIGMDLVSATANDIVVLGAKPLTLLDYIANDQLNPAIIEEIVTGMASACCDCGISLVGGETAEMPGTYLPGEHDLVGVITGVVEKDKAILGKGIKKDDVVLAFPSNGLHTNGYSLARKLLFDVGQFKVDRYVDELQATVGEALLEPHVNYTNAVHSLLEKNIYIKGMAHITGGGLIENLPRILPEGLDAEVDLNVCPVLPIFKILQHLGKLPQEEAYTTFNMGIGLIMIADEEMAEKIKKAAILPVYQLGTIVEGSQTVRFM